MVHKNTRFLRDPFSQALSRSQLQQAAALNAQVRGRASGVAWASSPFWSWPPPYVRTVLGLSRAWRWGCVWVPMWRGLSLFSICGGFGQTRSVGQVCASSRGVGWARCGGQQRFLSPDLLQGGDSGRHGVEEVGGGGLFWRLLQVLSGSHQSTVAPVSIAPRRALKSVAPEGDACQVWLGMEGGGVSLLDCCSDGSSRSLQGPGSTSLPLGLHPGRGVCSLCPSASGDGLGP